ncbi:MAG: LptF/LptG family permease [Candidatus Omnitrophica bacterium]|nr:LptF/LptG family permease [Candidatus Omnitrophota bacterium]
MRIIRNYFLSEFFSNFFFSFLIITFFMVLGNLMVLPDLIIRKGIGVIAAFQIFIYRMPYLLIYTLPLSCLLGVLLSMGRISADNEIIALKVAGIAFSRILAMFFVVGLIISLFLIVLNDSFIPRVHFASRKLYKQVSKENPFIFIEPGSFVEFNEYKLFAQDIERNSLKKVFIYELKEGSSNVIYADEGDFVIDESLLKIKLKDGFIEGPGMKYRIHFKNHFMHLPIEKEGAKASKKAKDMGIKEIKRKIERLEQEDIDPLPLRVEFHRKISLSFSSVVFVLLGFGIAGIVRHREKNINIGICILVGLLYYFLADGLDVGKLLAFKGIMPAFLSMWTPNIVFLAIGGYFSYKICVS